jgi:type II secretory pathway component PulM
MISDYKASNVRILRNVLLVILCITFLIGAWRILIDTNSDKIPEAQKVFKEEKNLEK